MTAILRIISISLIAGLVTACGGAAGPAGGSPSPVVGAAAAPTITEMPASSPTPISTGAAGSPSPVVGAAVSPTITGMPAFPIPTADPAVALLRYTMRGGKCRPPPGSPACESVLTIDRDGRFWSYSISGPGAVATMTAADLHTLTDQIATMDLDRIRATPFTGDCPTMHDGKEIIITFFMPTGPEVLASCTVVMDFTQPPLSTIKDVLNLR